MKERPILFSGEMIRAILEGRKTQTRRVVKPQPQPDLKIRYNADNGHVLYGSEYLRQFVKCPCGQPGDRLWVRETWQPNPEAGASYPEGRISSESVVYAADCSAQEIIDCAPWKPSIFMPRWASRITLEITGVRVERIQSISTTDILAEGVEVVDDWGQCRINTADGVFSGGASWCYQSLWDSINEQRGYGWDVNPWVWVIEFKKAEAAPCPA